MSSAVSNGPPEDLEQPGTTDDPSEQPGGVTRRSFLHRAGLVAGTALVVGTGGLGYRAYDQGVFEAGEGGAYDAWGDWERGAGPLALVSAAILAANPHNSQAWVFRGAYYVLLGATALGVAGALGIVGGALLWVVPAAAERSHQAAYAVLLAGALPFAAATWWSVATPLIAMLAIWIGHTVVRHTRETDGRSREALEYAG